jgi:hypothetical protein
MRSHLACGIQIAGAVQPWLPAGSDTSQIALRYKLRRYPNPTGVLVAGAWGLAIMIHDLLAWPAHAHCLDGFGHYDDGFEEKCMFQGILEVIADHSRDEVLVQSWDVGTDEAYGSIKLQEVVHCSGYATTEWDGERIEGILIST